MSQCHPTSHSVHTHLQHPLTPSPSSFLVAVPAIIKSTIDSAELPVHAGSMDAVSAHQVRFGLTTQLNVPAAFTVGLDAFTLDLYNVDTPDHPSFVTLAVPAQTLKGTTPIDIPPQVVDVHNTAELTKFISRAFTADRGEATIGVRGTSVARLGGGGGRLSYPVAIDKVVQLDGLRGLDGLHVEELVPVTPNTKQDDDDDDDGTTLRGSLWLPNESVLSLGLGNVSYDVSVAGVRIGETRVADLHIVPGDQRIQYGGKTDADAVMGNARTVLGSLDEDGKFEFLVTGRESTVNGEHIGYLDDVLSKINVKTQVDICTAMASLGKEAMGKMPLSVMGLLPWDRLMDCM